MPLGFDLSVFEAIADDKPTEARREWIIPAALVNSWPRRVLDEEEVDDLDLIAIMTHNA